MSHLLALDLGTSSVKAVVINQDAHCLAAAAQEYPLLAAQPGWAEQEPEQWWQAAVQAAGTALAQAGHPAIAAIGLSGQMHGTVLVDAAGRALGRAITWADQRSAAQSAQFNERIGAARLAAIAGTAPAAGFLGPTLLWLQHHDPARLAAAHTCLLPKDYLRLRLTGEPATEATDASATALFDVRRRTWSLEIVQALELPAHLLPRLIEPSEVAGTLRPAAAAALGLPAGIPVAAGCADQAAQALGNGLMQPGQGSVTIGSGGQVFLPLAVPRGDPLGRLHTFCHAPADRWYLLGAMLTAGLSLRWLRDLLGWQGAPDAYQRLAMLAAATPPGADGLLFLPYLAGERSPLMDPQARGAFVGLTLQHGPGHLARAIMEGVAFALRQILAVMGEMQPLPQQLLAVGNGLAAPVWRQITADVLGCPLLLPAGREQAGVGAGLLAGIAAGLYADYTAAQQILPPPNEATWPQPGLVALYADHYARFCTLYPALHRGN
ncbi:MAG: xylulokinase [Caldilineales bacterium]